jgi:hypothetical protein
VVEDDIEVALKVRFASFEACRDAAIPQQRPTSSETAIRPPRASYNFEFVSHRSMDSGGCETRAEGVVPARDH